MIHHFERTTTSPLFKMRSIKYAHFSSKYVLLLIAVASLFVSVLSQGQDPQIMFTVREEQEKGTYVGNVARQSMVYTQLNQSEIQNLQYSLPPTVSQFVIDTKTSTIRTAKRLNREEECEGLLPSQQCILKVGVSIIRVSGETFRLLKVIKIGVVITDVNDNPPEFPSNKTTLDVPESLSAGEVLRTSGAIDRDSGVNNTVQSYSLQGGNGMFELEVIPNPNAPSADLGIVLKSKLDRETKSSYKLKIIAVDGGYPKLTGSVDILINVVDVNDNPPLFTRPYFETTVPENAPVSTTILKLLASDLDEQENGKLSFSFSSLTSGKVRDHFFINESSGEIVIKKALDYEKDTSFRFTAVVSDNGSPARSSQTSVTITVQDVNDNAPKLDITIPSSKIKESAQVGNYIAHISLSDQDSNSGISCSIGNPNFMLQKFPDSESIFTVLLRTHLDYEKSHKEVVNVTCNDGGNPPRSNTSSFTIQVLDVNDNAPIFTRNTYKFDIDENNYSGQFVAQIKAVDPDEGEYGNVTYSLLKNPENKFQINRLSGVIKAMTVLDRESVASFELVVSAKDGGQPPIESSATVTVLVNDVNDNSPYFTRPHFDFRVQENRPKHTIVDQVIAEDKDIHSDNHLRYAFADGFPYHHLFAMDRMSGTIFTLASLDREKNDSYSFDVKVYDETQSGFEDTTRVTILVRDDNDIRPNITYPNEINNTFNILYTRTVGSVIITVEANDRDAGENGSISYAIASGNVKGLFFINSLTGDLLVAERMNIYDSGSYKLVIRARDGGSSFLESTRDVNIIVTVANGTVGAFGDDNDSTNIAIVIALVCVTVVLALAVLITICIIRRIDRERKHHHHAKVEEENIYKQQVIPGTPQRGDSYENELDKLKRKIKRDMSFVVEDDSNPLDASDASNKSSTFSTFKNTTTSPLEQKVLSTPQAHSSVLHNTLSPSDSNPKRVHYMDKGLDIDRLTNSTPPPRSQPTMASSLSSSQSSLRGGKASQWGAARAKSPRSSVVKVPVEDAASHSSGSTSDSGRGCSSEEGEGQVQGHAMVVALGDSDTERPTLHAYPTSAPLLTFGSPRSHGSSSGTSNLPRSLSSSWNSETNTKRPWNDVTNTSSSPNSSMSASQHQPPSTHQQLGFPENSSNFKPNISLSDDSVTANTSVRPNVKITPKPKSPKLNTLSNPSSPTGNLKRLGARSSDALSAKPTKSPGAFTSTTRPRIASYEKSSDSPYRLMEPNVSRIPNADSSVRHGMFVEGPGTSMMEPSMASRSRSYAAVNGRGGERERSNRNSIHNGGENHRNSYHGGSQSDWRPSNLNRVSSCENNSLQQTTTIMGDPYSLADVDDVLCNSSNAGSRLDDDNTTTTSGSYTINADDLCQEIDHLFFNDIVV